MTLLTRAAKGSWLTNAEADANIVETENRLKLLERGSASGFTDPRSPSPYAARLIPGGVTREPCCRPGDEATVFAFPASAVSGAQVTLHEWQRDTVLLADAVSVLPRALPFAAPAGAAITTGANVNVVLLLKRGS